MTEAETRQAFTDFKRRQQLKQDEQKNYENDLKLNKKDRLFLQFLIETPYTSKTTDAEKLCDFLKSS